MANPLSVLSLPLDGSVGFSLLVKKTKLNDPPCFWKLKPGTGVHALNELSVCALVRLKRRGQWTGFVYKAPEGENIELGLQGTSSSLDVWLLGEKVHVKTKLEQNQWYSICITWSSQALVRLHIYINGINQSKISAGPYLPRPLALNGTLTLGVSHDVDSPRRVMTEDSSEPLGEIRRFRMWSKEWSPEELSGRNCADEDALDWDPEQWRYGCSPDGRFSCGKSRVAQISPACCVVPEGD